MDNILKNKKVVVDNNIDNTNNIQIINTEGQDKSKYIPPSDVATKTEILNESVVTDSKISIRSEDPNANDIMITENEVIKKI